MDPNAVPTSPTISSQTPLLVPKAKSNNLVIILGIIALIIVLSLGGFYLGRVTVKEQMPMPVQTPPASITEILKADPFFDTQTAVIKGEVVDVKGPILVAENNQGQIREFSISPELKIFWYNFITNQSTSSADLKMLEFKKEAGISLKLVNGQYQVTSISYKSLIATPAASLKL